MTPKFLGLDIASTTGWAFIDEQKRWHFGTCRAQSPQKHDVLAWAKENDCTHAVLECPVPMRGGAKSNHSTTQISMGRSMGRWEEACDIAGLIVIPVYVASWQAAMLVANGHRLDNADKAGSLLIARSLGAAVTNGDQADAVCLAAYGSTALKRAECEALEKKMVKAAKARVRRKK